MVNMNKIKKLAIITLVLSMVLSTAACGKPAEQEAVPVAAAPEKQNIVEAFGVIKAADIHNINLGFTAAVAEVAVREGQKVHKDEVLMTLDIKDYMTQINAKQHDLNALKLEIKKLQNKMIELDASKSKDPDVLKLTNDMKYAEKSYQSALKEQGNKEALYQTGAISKYELDEYAKVVETHKKTIDDLNYNLDITMHSKQIGNKELLDSIGIQQERAAAIEREIAAMKEKLSQSYIKGEQIVADIENGVVFDLSYVSGDIVNPAQKALSILNLDDMVVRANVSEEFIKDVKSGAMVKIIPIADKTKEYTGTVKMIASRAEVQNGETVVPIEITIDNNDGFLLPEYNVDVEITY